jgi:hypothetical protein
MAWFLSDVSCKLNKDIMKKIITMIALAAISFGSVYAAPVQERSDTTKTKMKKKGDKSKMKNKMNDTTKQRTKKDSVR